MSNDVFYPTLARWRGQVWRHRAGRAGVIVAAVALGLTALTVAMSIVTPLPVTVILGSVGGAWLVIVPAIVFASRPTWGDVAARADERFFTHDLFATALRLRPSNDPWTAALAHQATTRARALADHRLVPPAVSARALSALAAGAGVVAVLLLVTRVSADLREQDAARLAAAERDVDASGFIVRRASPSAGAHESADATSDDPRRQTLRQGETQTEGPQRGEPRDPAAGADAADPRSDDSMRGDTDSAGARATNPSGTAVPPPPADPDATSPRDPAAQPRATPGRRSTGTGRAAESSDAADVTSSADSTSNHVLGSDRRLHTAPNDQTTTDRRAEALQAVRTGLVPATTRDLVRDYFER